MSLTWAHVDQLARSQALSPLTERLLALSEDERLAFGAEVEAGIRATRGEDWWGRGYDPAPGFALAVIACLPSAARAAAMLTRSGMRDGWGAVPLPHWDRITETRGLDWLPDLGARLAARLPAREAWTGDWRFVAALLRGRPELAPASEGFVRGWLADLHDRDDYRVSFADAMRASPYLDALLPAVFEIDGLGGALTSGYRTSTGWSDKPALPEAVAILVADGRLDRAVILAATRDRLVRGDRPAWLRPFALLHEELAPAVAELAAATGDYTGLLAGAPSPIAGLAQRALRAVDDAGLLEFATLLETSVATLQRPEKGLVKIQLSWLERLLRRHPDRAGEILETIAVAFGHPGLDVRERALTLIGRHLTRAGAATVARLADAATVLGGDLPARAAELFGVAAPAPEEPVEALAAPAPAAAMPAPITGATELAGEIVALLHDETAVGWERVLSALVVLPASGVPLAEALNPVFERHRRELADQHWFRRSARTGLLGDVIRGAVALSTPGTPPYLGLNTRALNSGPAGVLILRLREIAERMASEPVNRLVATPTRVDGSLDPAVLLERLRQAEAEGRPPWPVDFEQALLRLPREAATEVTTAAAELTSSTGRRFAAWLKEGGLPDPVVTRREQTGTESRYRYGGTPPVSRRVVVQVDPSRAGGDGLVLEGLLTTVTRGDVPSYHAGDFAAPAGITAAVLPHHREIVAAWSLPVIAALADMDQRGEGGLLPVLAECAGPIGPAMTLALAYGLAAKDAADRLAAVDAMLILAAGEEPFAAALGAEIGDLGADGTIKLTRVLPGLSDAARAGAVRAVWEVLAAALPVLLPVAPRGLPDLLELGTLVAGRAGERDDVPGLAEAAARPGGSRLAREARRLHTVLAG